MKRFFACLFLLSVIEITGAAHKKWDSSNSKGFTVSKSPKYNDTVIKVTGWCNKDDLFAEVAKQKSSFFVELPLASAGLSATLVKDYGMKFYHADEKRIQYVKSTENAPIPPLLTSIITVKVFISRMHEGHLQVLFTKEDKERLAASLPGGTVDYNEMPCKAALREVHEELGIILPLDQLLFMGCLQRDNAFAYRMALNEHVYHTLYNGQEIFCDGREVKGFVWGDVESILKTGTVNGLTVLAHHLYVLQLLREGKRGKACVIMPDHRQLNLRAEEDSNDTMIFCPAE